MPRRRPGSLLPLEIAILAACLEAGEHGSHGFALAKSIAEAGDERRLTATGTMYRALHRLDAAGLVESSWEDPNEAAEAGRPRRRNYRITGAGTAALVKTRSDAPSTAAFSRLDPALPT